MAARRQEKKERERVPRVKSPLKLRIMSVNDVSIIEVVCVTFVR